MGKINILFLMMSMNVGGTERHILDIISRLNRNKFNPVFCFLYNPGTLGEQLVSNKKHIKVYSDMFKNKYDIPGLWRLLRVMRNENIHILYTINSPLTQIWGTLLAKLSGTNAFITRVATTKPRYHVKRRIIANKLMLPLVDRIIAQADTHKEYLVRVEGMPREKIEVIYNGIEIDRFEVMTNKPALKESLGIAYSYPVIGIVARLAPEKGHTVFLKAAKMIMSEFPDVSFLIIGDGEEKQRLKELTRTLGIKSSVVFLGTRNDVPELLSIIDIAVLSSDSVVETVSNAVLEYMASGKPVVATRAGSTEDLVVDGETGFIISCGDHEALAGSILKLLKTEGLIQRMGENGRERVKVKFKISRMIEKYENLFLDLISAS